MQQFITIFLIFLKISDLTWAENKTTEPYCDRNVTEVSYKTVTKTRVKTVTNKKWYGKSKTESKMEEFSEQEPVYKIKLERSCCDGYKMSDLNLCEPQCVENGCPEHSKCVDPDVCECIKGYFSSSHDGKHFCKPICARACPDHSVCVAPDECACKQGYRLNTDKLCKPHCLSGCPHGGVCLAPNKCECTKGYKSEHDSCLPMCSLGDQCQNGECVDTETCKCNYGYILNDTSHSCELNLAKFKENQKSEYIESSSINYQEITESLDQSHSSLELETDIDTPEDDIDPNETFEEIIDSTTYSSTGDDSPSVNSHKCPDDYVFHQGQCKPLKFASLEIDCRFKPCNDPHAICMDNGTCACTEGFKWFRSYDKADLKNPIKSICLPLADYEARVQELKQGDPVKSVEENPTNWATIFFISLGVFILIIAMVYLGLIMVWAHRGEFDVEGKTLSCAYDNRAVVDSEKSVI